MMLKCVVKIDGFSSREQFEEIDKFLCKSLCEKLENLKVANNSDYFFEYEASLDCEDKNNGKD